MALAEGALRSVSGAQFQVARTYRQKVKSIFDEEGIDLDAPATYWSRPPSALGWAPPPNRARIRD